MGENMSLVLKQEISINNTFRKVIQSGNYEKIIFELMNKSKVVFPGKFQKKEEQPDGECDFVNSENKKKYEAKLFLGKDEGKLISSNNYDYEKWLNISFERIYEYSEYIYSRGTKDIKQLQLYKIFDYLLPKIKEDENIILLFLYPITLDIEGSILPFCSDVLTDIYQTLKTEYSFSNRDFYVIYPTVNGEVVLRDLKNDKREYFIDNQLSEFIRYDLN